MRVLVVDDSPVSRMLLRAVLEGEGYEVREASTGDEALQVLTGFTPDIVTMDVHMPGMDGYETTERILESYALPVVILSASINHQASATAMRALEAGALAVLEKPAGPTAVDFEERIDELLRTLRSMVQVKIVRRKRRASEMGPADTPPLVMQTAACAPQLVAISASAGGPLAVKALLQSLAPQQPWPLVLVQHIAPGFLPSFRDWLATLTPIPIVIAERGQRLTSGALHLAPDGHHLGFAANRSVILDDAPPEEHVRPAANYLFRSVARHFGKQAIGIQMSGMGRDGAQGLAEMCQAGALTLVQEPSTAVIDSMPKAAIGLQAARQVLSPEGIANLLNAIAAHMAAVNGSNRRE
ncbi:MULTISPECIES: chemotaxis protein CheB [unclassified Pseudomonas]|uniref:chemotaxis protein CheB n=1 Tax=unclassified Pseudomonas TaxID=196821 RepID=UPI0024492844|nr:MULTISPECIES: chemotaxis protein CheB [unclassified Pseudomonas]MDG9922912.1 chemotaxis protein CheB [Pseudomonas sp. GD04045]MDH0035724.1 chemotaxis protein CheB [Pseudomonas sp. GD04019]